jgi:hypothetical protein
MGTNEASPKNRWFSILAGVTAFSTIVSAVIASVVASSASKREADLKWVDLAVHILQDSITPGKKNLRLWAINLFDHYSEVPLPGETRDALLDSLRLPSSPVYLRWSADGHLLGIDVTARPMIKCVADACDTTWRPIDPGDSFSIPNIRPAK